MTRTMKRTAALLAALVLTASILPVYAGAESQKLNTYYSLAVGYIGRENYDKAMEYLDAALGICSEDSDPGMYADLHLKKGCVFTIRREYEEGLKELDEAIRVSPELAEAFLVKVQVYSETDRPREAAENLEKYIGMTGDTSLNESLAQLYLQLENREKAAESYRKLAESISEVPEDIPYNLAVYEMSAGMYAEALKNLQSCESDPERMPGLYYNTGICRMMLEEYGEAAEAFTASLESENFRSDALYNRAVCRLNIQEFTAAAEDFTAYLGGLNQPEDPEAAPSDTHETEPVQDAAYYYRGVCYLSAEQYDSAVEDFTLCLENGINPDESRMNRGLSYLQGGKYEEAKADFTDSIENGYMADDALFYRSYAERFLDDNEAALADLSLCVEHGYNLGQTYQQRALVYQALGNEDDYLKDLEASLEYLED